MASKISIEGQYPSRVFVVHVYLKAPNLKRASLVHPLSIKKNMKGTVIFSVAVILGAGCTYPQTSASPQGARLGAIPFPGVGGKNEKPKDAYSDYNFELKCENDREFCKGHCSALGHGIGRCIDDVCYCYSGHPTSFECDRIAPVGEVVTSEKHRSCKIHCQLLSNEFVEGECIGGKCRCQERFYSEKNNKSSVASTSLWQQTYIR